MKVIHGSHQVEVEVVLKLRGVEDFEGDLGDLAGGLPGTPGEVRVDRHQDDNRVEIHDQDGARMRPGLGGT